MDRNELRKYLETRRIGWPYEDSYRVEHRSGHRFVAMIGDELAGLSYAEIISTGKEARIHMNLKARFAEYGIGTELLELLMEDLKEDGFDIIRYEILPERYSFQIYKNLGFRVESRDGERIAFIWERGI